MERTVARLEDQVGRGRKVKEEVPLVHARRPNQVVA